MRSAHPRFHVEDRRAVGAAAAHAFGAEVIHAERVGSWMIIATRPTRVRSSVARRRSSRRSRGRAAAQRRPRGRQKPYYNTPYFTILQPRTAGHHLNTRHARGSRWPSRLIGISDAVVENFSGEVVSRAGGSPGSDPRDQPARRVHEHVGFGHSGPYKAYRSFGPHRRGPVGLVARRRVASMAPAAGGSRTWT